MDLVVLGAGPAGIGAAYRAALEGHRVTVLERAPGPGGAAGSITVAGQRVDLGSHRLHPATAPEVLGDIQKLLGADLQRRSRHGRIRLDGRWIAFPLRPADAIRRLPRRLAFEMARDGATALVRRRRDEHFAAVLRTGVGPALSEAFYFPYARKLWGLEPEEISAEQAHRRVSAGSPVRLAMKLLRGGRESGYFFYPRHGFGQIWERLAEAASAAGADIRFGTEVASVKLTDSRASATARDGSSAEGSMVFSSIPLPALARLTDPPPSEAEVNAASELEFRSMLLVYLVLDADRYTLYDAHYFPEASTPVTRVSEPKNYRTSSADPRGRTVLCAEIPCGRGEWLWAASDETLGAMVLETLHRAGLPPVRLLEVVAHRLPQAYPILRRGYERAFRALDEWAAGRKRLLTLGRQGLFVHDNSHHALAMAWAAADALGDDGIDRGSWADARARFAQHKVED